MKRILATTAIALVSFAPAFAQEATTAAEGTTAATETAAPADAAASSGVFVPAIDQGIRASQFIGKRVYTSEAEVTAETAAGMGEGWQDVGEISDVILGPSGGVDAVLVDVGGFLGIGEKTVAVDLSQIRRVADESSADNYFLVFRGTKAELESAPAFADPAMAAMDGTAATDPAATDPAATDPAAAPAADTATETAAETAAETAEGTVAAIPDLVEGPVDFSVRAAEQWVGTRVYDPAEKDIGEISGVAGDGSTVSGVIVDVGGFLGIGEKRVQLTADMLSVVPDADGEGTHVQVNATAEQLEALPAHEG
jgi:hypothetical protein